MQHAAAAAAVSASAAFLGFQLGRSAGPAAAFTHFMAKVKLGRKEFDVDSEVIDASWCEVTDADCAALAARMKSGEIRRVKKLWLVRFLSVLFPFSSIFRSSTSDIESFYRTAIASATTAPGSSLTGCK